MLVVRGQHASVMVELGQGELLFQVEGITSGVVVWHPTIGGLHRRVIRV
jgi:hypothetical protein